MLRLYVQLDGLGMTKGLDPAWEPTRLFILMGRQDILLDFCEMGLKSGEVPGMREDLRRNPLYDPLRRDPRFQALLEKYPLPEAKK